MQERTIYFMYTYKIFIIQINLISFGCILIYLRIINLRIFVLQISSNILLNFKIFIIGNLFLMNLLKFIDSVFILKKKAITIKRSKLKRNQSLKFYFDITVQK